MKQNQGSAKAGLKEEEKRTMGNTVETLTKESTGTVRLREEDRQLFADLLAAAKKPAEAPKEAVLAQEPAEVAKKPEPTEEEADMEARFRIPGMKGLNVLGKTAAQVDKVLWNIPIGSVALGLVPGAIVGDLVDGFVPPSGSGALAGQVPNAIARGIGAAFVMSNGVKRVIGPTASVVAAATLLTPIAARVLPLDRIVSNIVGFVRPRAVKSGQYSALRQAEYIANQGPISGGTQYPGLF